MGIDLVVIVYIVLVNFRDLDLMVSALIYSTFYLLFCILYCILIIIFLG